MEIRRLSIIILFPVFIQCRRQCACLLLVTPESLSRGRTFGGDNLAIYGRMTVELFNETTTQLVGIGIY